MSLSSGANIKNTVIGLLLVIFFSAMAAGISSIGVMQRLGLSPVVIGIMMGMVFGNLIPNYSTKQWRVGILFSVKYILRAAIIFYGFRITFQHIISVGMQGLLVSFIMVVSTFLLGIFIGKRVLKIDRDIAVLTAAGSAVCGAAAVLATESVLRSDPHKSAIAITTVVLFGTISMFIYPAFYHSGILNLNTDAFGVYIGGSIQEVAQVVVAGNAVSETSAASGIIVKMTRVMMLAPFLLITGFFLFAKNSKLKNSTNEIPVPYFVFGFILVAGINSLHYIPENGVDMINTADTFLLTMAMCAIGIETRFSKFKEAGTKPMYLATVLFAWLIIGGFVVTKFVLSVF